MPTSINAKTINVQNHPPIIDVRSPDEFLQEHIAGSQNIPLNQIAQATEQLKGLEQVIISCRSGNRAGQACNQLEQLGLSNLLLLEGGIEGWKQAGYATVKQPNRFSIMQQVQLTVGTMILLGTFFKPLWILAVMAGVGMLMAGLTNTCMLATLLGKLPWNKHITNAGCKL